MDGVHLTQRIVHRGEVVVGTFAKRISVTEECDVVIRKLGELLCK